MTATPNTTPAKKVTKKSERGVRYTPEQKKEVVDFVKEYNRSKGRGGQTAASQKFGVSPLTISTWLRADGKPPKARKARKAAKRTGARQSKTTPVTTSGSLEKKIDSLKELAAQIDMKKAELAQLTAQFQSLKTSL